MSTPRNGFIHMADLTPPSAIFNSLRVSQTEVTGKLRLGVKQRVQCCSSLPASCPVLIGAHNLVWQFIITIPFML